MNKLAVKFFQKKTIDIEETGHKQKSADWNTLEDLKIEFRRKFDSKVSKNDLMRAALHLLVNDHKEKSEKSFVGRMFIGKPRLRR